jgi:hypothetical protein
VQKVIKEIALAYDRNAARPLHRARNADGSWMGVAEFLDEPQPAIKAEGFALQAEALDGALSRAMAKIDVERRFRGKPT